MTYRPAPVTGCAVVTLALLTALGVGLWVCIAYLIAWVTG